MAVDAPPTLRQRLEYLGLSAAVWLVGRLPYAALRRIAVVLGALVYSLDSRGRAVALANLDAAFGEKFSPARKRQIARGSYQSFARSMLELLWSPNLTREFTEKIFRITGVEPGSFHYDPNQAVIYVCLHYGNFEWLSQFAAFHTGRQPVVTQRFKNPLIGQIFNRLRSSTGHTILPQERAMIRMLKHLKSGGKFNMLVDLNLDPSEPSVIINEFGGLKTCVTQMHALLADRCRAKLVPAECRPLPDGTYEMRVHKPLEYPEGATPAQIAQMCWDVLEPSVQEQPECWLWSYKHWRFRPAGDTSGRYPFYSNEAKRFDKLLKSHV
jgi:KDO2-lipid IV(A) lauroyltransferase